MQVDVVRTILEIYPSWSINDVLETDTKNLHEIIFGNNKNRKKQKEIKPLSDLVKGGG